ncbi:MAG: hypothetical protein EOP89_03580 [Lysobacteraceae bacterium]|nr:MAG: hypothetical protein EOP89_03580 [Xanthomonadaceae bacterium]
MTDPYAFTGDRQPGESWSARHERMLLALPAEGGTLIVITNEVGRSLMRALRYYRGFDVRKRWRFIAARRHGDCQKLEGLRGRIVVDWTFEAHAAPAARDQARALIAATAAMQP